MWLFKGRISPDLGGRGYQTEIIWWENLSGLWQEDPRLSLLMGESLRIKAEDPRLWVFGVRTSPDYGGRIQDCHYSVGEFLLIMAGGFQIFIFLWENLSILWLEGSRFSFSCGRISPDCGVKDSRLSFSCGRISPDCGVKDSRLSFFCGRISLDCGGRIQDCHYSVEESLRIVAGGSKIVIILWESLSGLWWEDSRLALLCRRISPDCGRRIPDCHDSVGRRLQIAAWGSTVRLWLFDGRISPDGGGRIYCKIVIIRRDDLSGLRREDLQYCKFVIIRWEDLSGMWREDPRLSLFIG